MSLRQLPLGSAAAATRGIVMSAIGTGTPSSVTLTAGHRLRNGVRIAIAGNNTSDLGTFGEWTVSGVAAGSAVLDGSAAAVAISGTPVVAVVCDKTPFLPRHSAVAMISTIPDAAATDGLGTVVLEAADTQISTGFQYDASGVATAGFKSALKSGEIAIPAFTDFGAIMVEVDLSRYMTMRVSAWTSGGFGVSLIA